MTGAGGCGLEAASVGNTDVTLDVCIIIGAQAGNTIASAAG